MTITGMRACWTTGDRPMLEFVAADDPAAFSEGFCPRCRGPLDVTSGPRCRACRISWYAHP